MVVEKKRIALVIQYLGSNYCGWQRQAQHNSIQEEIERVITEFLGKKVQIHGAGRTDSGVHAAAQVAHFDDRFSPIPPRKWAKILNDRLPSDIRITASKQVDNDWHARFSAQFRRYRYTIYTGKQPNVFLDQIAWHYYHQPLAVELMEAALTPMLGKYDLRAFRRANSTRAHSLVEIQEIKCFQSNLIITVEIQADGFLYGMVRLIMGLLIEVGRKKLTPNDFTQIWQTQDRPAVKYSAPAKGLCLLRVGYENFPFTRKVWYDNQPYFSLPIC